MRLLRGPHKSWKARWEADYGSTVTGPEAEYPRPLCEAMAAPIVRCEAEAPALAARLPFAFLEVFSGPHAPLTQAVRRAMALKRQETANQGEGTKGVPAAGALPPRA